MSTTLSFWDRMEPKAEIFNRWRSMEQAEKVIDKMLYYIDGRQVIRTGIGVCGAYGDSYFPGQKRAPRAHESILEHQAATAVLLMWIHRCFPDAFESTDFYLNMLELLLVHDVVENESGDRCDDGDLSKVDKSAYELKQMQRYASWIYRDFELMERVDGKPAEEPGSPRAKDENFGQVAFMCDKLQALIQLGWLEMHDVKPTLTYKLIHHGGMSERDQFYMDLTSSDVCLDAWTAHMLDYCKSYYCFDEVFLPLVEALYRKVRKCKNLPAWTQKILADRLVRCWLVDKD